MFTVPQIRVFKCSVLSSHIVDFEQLNADIWSFDRELFCRYTIHYLLSKGDCRKCPGYIRFRNLHIEEEGEKAVFVIQIEGADYFLHSFTEMDFL